VPDVERRVRGEASGNDAQISEAAQSGRLEREVLATPSMNYDRVSHTLRLVEEPIVRDQEVMLPVQSGRPEGGTEIPVYEGGILSSSETQTDAASVLLDKELRFSETAQSLVETQTDTALVTNDKSYRKIATKNEAELPSTDKSYRESSASLSSLSQKGGPWPPCSQEDQRPCQSGLPVKATGASLGRVCLSEPYQSLKP
jgi:hypothetical protein